MFDEKLENISKHCNLKGIRRRGVPTEAGEFFVVSFFLVFFVWGIYLGARA